MKTYYWCDGSGRIEIEIPQAWIDSVCHSGSNDVAVAALPRVGLNPEHVRKALSEYGAWDNAELSDDSANLNRILWIACWDCFDNPESFAA